MSALLALGLLAATPAAAQTFPPRDECAADASFVAFRAALKRAIRAKDAKAVLAVTTPDITWSLVEDAGRTGFARHWGLSRPARSDLWATLDHALSRGCSLDDSTASAPYLYGHPPPGDIVDSGVIDGASVNVRAAPAPDAKVLRQSSWEMVGLGRGGSVKGFTEIVLTDGTLGYVANEFVWTIRSHRAQFRKVKGKWVMVMFVAGD